MSTTTFSAQVEEDSELVDQFEEYRESNSMTSKSEAVRTLIREGLEDDHDQDESDDTDGQRKKSATQPATPLQDALADAGLLDRRFAAYAIFGVVVSDIYDLMVDVGTFFVSLGTVNTVFTSVALLVVAMFIVDYGINPLVATLQDDSQDERRAAQGAD
jgi:Arc/MetJ-type ribon-helix-helix transcriptional regulator